MADFITKVRSSFRYLRLQPFDTSTEEGRAAERHRRIALSALWSIAGKVFTVLVPLVTIPLTLRYLGRERYGIWMTLSALTASLGFADLGLGNGLLNAIADCNGRDDREGARMLVSSAFFMLSAVGVLLALAYWVAAPHIPWGHLLKAASPAALREVPAVMAVFLLCFLLNLPLAVVDRVYLGYQEGFASSIAQLFGSALYLAGVIVVVKADLGLPMLVLASSGMPILVLLVNGVRLFFFRRPWLLPRLSLVQVGAMRSLFKTGSLFFALQICAVISFSSDNLVISGVKGAAAVADYSVSARLFGVILSVVPIAITPLWPALTEAASRHELGWVRRTLWRAMGFVSAITVSGGLFLFFAAHTIIHYWTHDQVHPTTLLLGALAVWTVLGGVGNVMSVFMNAMNFVRLQLIFSVLASALNLGLSIWLTAKYGPVGVVLGSAVSTAVFLVPGFLWVVPHILTTLQRRAADHAATLPALAIPEGEELMGLQ